MPPAADHSFLHSRFARQIFLLFVLSAVVPVVLVAVLSYFQTATQLRDQSYRQSLVTSKNVGLEVFHRLTAAETELLSVGKRVGTPQAEAAYPHESPAGDDASAFSMIAVISGRGDIRPLRGEPEVLPALSPEQTRELGEGGTVIVLSDTAGVAGDLVMLHSLAPGNPAGGLLAGVVSPARLWRLEDFYSAPEQLVVMDDAGRLIHGSPKVYHTILPTIKRRFATGTSGHLVWHADGERNLATFWSLFTRSGFVAPDMIFVLSRPEAAVLAPVSNFMKLYVPLLVLVVLLVSCLAAGMIRRKMAPLVTLRDATQRVARGDFSGHVRIDTGDEFTVLGNAFNSMTDRLHAQFTSIATMVEIDRLILSSFDAQYIISTVLERVGELTPCVMAALLDLDKDDSSHGTISYRHIKAGAAIGEDDVVLSEHELGYLQENPGHFAIELDGNAPSYTRVFNVPGVRNILLFPMFYKQGLSSVFLFGYTELPDECEECYGPLRKFADHVAVALSNAGWEDRLYHQAHYDNLTNLPNRALLKDRLEQAITRAQRSQYTVGVFFLDLDHFKLVNDSLGHAAGDQFLKRIASALQVSVREEDTVVRFGGDEFIIIMPDINVKDDVVSVLGIKAKRMLNAVQREFRVDNHLIRPKASIGIAAYPKDGDQAEELLRNADAAMYLAKGNGRSRYEFFAPELSAIASRRFELEQELNDALVNDEFDIYYQPKTDSRSGELTGAEALIRWHHPQRGQVSPGEFISIAEETGLILDIGEWIIRTVCRQIVAWGQAGLGPVPVAINVSARQFSEDNFVETLFEVLGSCAVEPGMIELEITESMVMNQTEVSIRKLAELRTGGLHLTLDDFGTGYSSLSYLRRLPLHTLKIDKSFIDELVADVDSHAIVSATILLAHKLGLEVVAEGVETPEQQRLLQEMHCDFLQGYLISRPLPADRFAEQFLGRQDCRSRHNAR